MIKTALHQANQANRPKALSVTSSPAAASPDPPIPPAVPAQTVVASSLPTPSWKSLGFVNRKMSYPLNRCFGLLVGEQNCGKSFLLQSNPDCFIINTDASSAVHPNGLVLTWDHVEEKRQRLIELATSDQPRPGCVALDTVTSAVRLVCQKVVRDLGKTRWEELDGRMGWQLVGSILVEFAMSLRAHGYGVWFVAHLTRTWRALTDSTNVEEIDIGLSDSLRSRLSKIVEVIVPVRARSEVVTANEPRTLVANGRQVTTYVPIQRTVKRRTLPFDDPTFERIVRTRTLRPLPTIELAGEDAWATFEKAYEGCRT